MKIERKETRKNTSVQNKERLKNEATLSAVVVNWGDSVKLSLKLPIAGITE